MEKKAKKMASILSRYGKKALKRSGIPLPTAILALSISFILLLSFGVVSFVEKSEAGSTDNVSGYAWSDNMGWISFNCLDEGTCSTSDYGVNIDAGTGLLSGFAWSSNIGWISFNTEDLTGCPSGTCEAKLNSGTGAITGWARALAPLISIPSVSALAHWTLDSTTISDSSGNNYTGTSQPTNAPEGSGDTTSIGHWRMSSATTITDVSGNGRDGTITGTLVNGVGQLGLANTFDGNDSISMGDVAAYDFGTGNFSISGWLKTTSTNVVVLSKRGICNYGNFYDLDINSSGKLAWEVSQNASADAYYESFPSVTSVNNGVWHHFVVLRNGTALQIYIDGSLNSASTASVANLSNTASFLIGASACTPTYSGRFNGSLDDIRVFNKALSSGEISALYSAGTSGGNGPTQTAGHEDEALQFDGSDDYISINSETPFDFERTSPFSISAWIKTSGTGVMGIATKKDAGAPYRGYSFYVSNGKLVGQLISTWNTSILQKTTSSSINNNAWRHVTMTYDGTSSASGLTLYIDGAPASATTDYNNLSTSLLNNQNLNIGWDQTGLYYFNGSLDDVRVYSSALNASQVDQIYDTGTLSSSYGLDPDAGDWDGWIKLNGTSPTYGVTKVGNFFKGFAWGSDVVSWISFNSRDCDSNSDGFSDGTPTGCPGTDVQIPPYGVETTATNVPTITSFTALPTGVVEGAGETVTFTWTSTDAQSCTASGGWSGTRPTSGSADVVVNYTSAFTLTCTNSLGDSAPLTVYVTADPPDFSLEKSGDINAVYVGSLNSETTITVVPLNGFGGEVTLSAEPSTLGGVPVTYEFSSNSNLSSDEYSSGSVLTVSTEEDLPTGNYSITVRGVSGTIEKTIQVNLYTSQVRPKYEEI